MDLGRTVRRRMIVLLIMMAGWVAVVIVRLAAVQIVNFEKLSALAHRQQLSAVEIHGERGAILDTRGRALALSRKLKSFYAVPSQISDPVLAAKAIGRVVNLNEKRLLKRLRDPSRDFVWVARKLSDEQAGRVRALELSGIQEIEEPGRVYPRGRLAAHVLGYVGIDNDGLAGIEHRYDEFIRGAPGRRITLRDARGVRFMPEPGGQPAQVGDAAVLTIDAVVQHHVQTELQKAAEKAGAKSAVAVALDPRTGELLALASWPDYDPNHYGRYSQKKWRNKAITAAFEPGSTFKMVTFAAAIEGLKLRRNEIIDCSAGAVTIAGHRIADHRLFQLLTPIEVMAQSSNVGTILIGRRLKRQSFYEQMRRFGFGELTDVDLPGEGRGLLREPGEWSGLSQASLSIGQELSVTAVQLVSAFGAIANGGVAMNPYVMKRMVSASGELAQSVEPVVRQRVVSKRTALRLQGMLEEVVRTGTGKLAALNGYTAAGKTGTAQKTGPDGGGYLADKYVASFVGFAPSRRARVVLLVSIDEPQGLKHGGDVAAPAFRAMMQPILAYLAVPPDLEERRTEVAMQDFFPESVESATGPVAPSVRLAFDAQLKGAVGSHRPH
jgi:cell division protein FtsI (penicillin-binding protein 3)